MGVVYAYIYIGFRITKKLASVDGGGGGCVFFININFFQ
jgi:hypothetical protein